MTTDLVHDPRTFVERRTLEATAVVESFYLAAFKVGVVVVALSAASAAALMPLRDSLGVTSTIAGVLAAVAVLAAAVYAHAHLRPVYRRVCGSIRTQLALAAFSAALVSLAFPLRSQLWVPACAIIALLAIVAPFRRVLAYCGLVLSANFVAHVVAGDLREIQPVTLVGLWVGFPFWGVIIYAGAGLGAKFVDRRYAAGAERRERLLWPEPGNDTSGPFVPDPPPRTAELATTTSERLSTCLNARELQAVRLTAIGYHNWEIAILLSLEETYVSKLLRSAREKSGEPNNGRLAQRVTRELLLAPDRDMPDSRKARLLQALRAF